MTLCVQVIFCILLINIVDSQEHEECLKYAVQVPEIPESSLVGDTMTTARQYPHMASLGFKMDNQTKWLCGGSLISERFVLTAAHCAVTRNYGTVAWVRLGDRNSASPPDESNSQDYRVVRSIRHPDYKPISYYNDIALLELDRNAMFTSFVKPACLFRNQNIDLQTHVIETGWGNTDFGGDISDTLQLVRLEFVTDKECVDKWINDSGRKLRNGIVPEQQLCAGSNNDQRHICNGNGGGPLQIYRKDEKIIRIVGITSFGKGCGLGGTPDVYTRVSYYVPWIESVVWPNE